MAEQKKEEVKADSRPATEAQLKLIGELLEETQCKEIPPEYTNGKMVRTSANAYINYLMEYKTRDKAIRSANKRPDSFDKIGFGMVYKLIWRAMSETKLATKPDKQQFIDTVIGEYVVFKNAQKACREHIEGGGYR